MAAALAAQVYFCKPYHSWEKGTVENTNGRIRRFLPKRASFPREEMDHEWLQERVDEMNNCPRKVLGCGAPNEVEALWKSGAALPAAGPLFRDLLGDLDLQFTTKQLIQKPGSTIVCPLNEEVNQSKTSQPLP